MIQLAPLTEDDLELVRTWRNRDTIRSVMEYSDIISPEAQRIWFNKLDKATNAYFIIVYEGEKIGLTHLKDVHQDGAEAGLFIADDRYLGTGVAYLASFALLAYAFEQLKLKCVTAKVNRLNEIALNYNRTLGFEVCDQAGESFVLMCVTPNEHLAAKARLLNQPGS